MRQNQFASPKKTSSKLHSSSNRKHAQSQLSESFELNANSSMNMWSNQLYSEVALNSTPKADRKLPKQRSSHRKQNTSVIGGEESKIADLTSDPHFINNIELDLQAAKKPAGRP